VGKKKFYLTTTLPYVNADPHIGFALETVQADVIARFKRLQGYDVFFNFGTDEHGIKVYSKACEENKDPKKYCDEYAKKFKQLKKSLNLSTTNFIRTTDKYHIKAAQEFWLKCLKNNDIYKKNYKSKYCNGCELEKTDSELVDGKCPIHPSKKIAIHEEENYFFRFSKYQKILSQLYNKNPEFVIPTNRLKEIKTFVKKGLQDFSISRLKSKMPWGIEVPNDPEHVMYVWFDALINYISTIGWPDNLDKFKKWWPVTQFAGKDNLRQQSAMWQSMLASAQLPFSKQIVIHGFITVNGQKISKSLGNVISPYDLVKKYGKDATRYFLLSKIQTFEDGDFTHKKFEDAYQADLANGLGNLVARISGLARKHLIKKDKRKKEISEEVAKAIEKYELNKALEIIWEKIKKSDVYINQRQIWNLKGKQREAAINYLIIQIRQIAYDLKPFLPETSETIEKIFNGPKVILPKSLFPRLSNA